MAGIFIEYNKKNGRFIITSPPWMVDRMRGLPSRKWDAKYKVWTAPAIRINAEYITQHLTDAILTTEARQAIIDSARRMAVLKEGSFPKHYIFKTNPYKHQRVGLDKMYPNNTFALFMEMRTGKSKIVVDYASAHHKDGNMDIAVIVCPYSIRRNWVQELHDHCPVDFSAHVLDTNKKKELEKWLASDHKFKWLMVGVESLGSGSAATYVERFLLTSTKALMAIDESHTIKTHSATRSNECVRLGMMADKRVIMTGTPMANNPMDLFMQFEFLDPAIIGTGDFYSFKSRYAVMGGYENKQIIGYQHMDELMEVVAPFVYQVSRADVFDLPPIIKTVRSVAMSAKQKALYNTMAKNKFTLTDAGALTAQTVLEKMLRLQEIAGGTVSHEVPPAILEKMGKKTDKPVYEKTRIDKTSAKVNEMMSVLEEITGSVIVWCSKRMEIEMVVEALSDKYGTDQVVEVHGGIDESTRHHNVYSLFQTGKARFLVGNQAVGGIGLKMSKAKTVIYYSNTFNYVDRAQSMDRTQSADQTESVLYIDLVSEGTVDEIILDALNTKKDVSEYINDSIREISARIAIAT